jgi:hypothetical protein
LAGQITIRDRDETLKKNRPSGRLLRLSSREWQGGGARHGGEKDPRGALIIEGTGRQGLTFRHADGSAYGESLAVVHADAMAQAFQALCQQGFREGEVRRALAKLTLPSGTEPSVEALIRQGVLRLTQRRVRARG